MNFPNYEKSLYEIKISKSIALKLDYPKYQNQYIVIKISKSIAFKLDYTKQQNQQFLNGILQNMKINNAKQNININSLKTRKHQHCNKYNCLPIIEICIYSDHCDWPKVRNNKMKLFAIKDNSVDPKDQLNRHKYSACK